MSNLKEIAKTDCSTSTELGENIVNLRKQLIKEFGKDVVILYDIEKENQKWPAISSGSLLLDDALGIHGYPIGRIIEIFGSESAGKTTLAIIALVEAQKLNHKVAFIDAEHAFDLNYAQKLGINAQNLLLLQPDTGEQALAILEFLVKNGKTKMIVIDSVAALIPDGEFEGMIQDNTIGLQARLMSKGLRRIVGYVSKNDCTIIFINQIREKVGVLYGNPEVTPGGRALRFYSSVRLDVRKGESLTKGSEIIGHKIKVKVIKNKLAAPFKIVSLDYYFETGFNMEQEIISIAIEKNIIQKNGGWYSYGDVILGQGKEKVFSYLKEQKDLFEQIKTKI